MKFKVGNKVKLNKNKKLFKYGKGGVSYEEIGSIKSINGNILTISFPSNNFWEGVEDELELVEYTYEDLKKAPIGTKITFENRAVLVKDEKNCFENVSSCRDIADLCNLKDNYSDLGKIIKIEEPTYATVYEYKPEILDEPEKRYLKQVIRPYKKVISIEKYAPSSVKLATIKITVSKIGGGIWDIDLPPFEKNAMYKNMKDNKNYTLEELGL